MSLPGNAGLQADLSELVGRRFECLERCQLCCLCQPEVLIEERPYFRQNFPDRLVQKRQPRRHTALALKKGRGSCSFLEGRRCTVYDHRPQACRQFPIHLYVGDRVQAELDLSCRGVWTGRGEDAVLIGCALVEERRDLLRSTLSQSRAVYQEFRENCMASNVHSDPERMRRQVASRITDFVDPAFIGRVLEMSTEESEVDLEFIAVSQDERIDVRELENAAREAAMESLSSSDPLSLPIYCDGNGEWNVFRARDGRLEWLLLDEDGDLVRKGVIDPAEVRLPSVLPSGTELLVKYLGVLNNRDSFLGHAYYLVDDYGYEDIVANVYCGSLATSVLDLLWRTSLLIRVRGGRADEEGIKEGIIFYDMDRLDAPTIGAFV